MIWELSQDASGNNSLLKQIRETAGNAVTSSHSREEDKTFSVYPNPTTGIFSVAGEMENTRIELYNTLGEKIRTFSGINNMDISGEPKGIYYLHLMKEKSTSIKRIVLQ